MAKRIRNVPILFRVTEAERSVIGEKMAELGTANMAAYLRKMALDGYVLKLELPELKEMVSLLRRISNNLNQLTKLANETGRVYEVDLAGVLGQQELLWKSMNELLKRLALLK